MIDAENAKINTHADDLENPDFRPEPLGVLQDSSISNGMSINNLPTKNCFGIQMHKIGNTYAFGFNEYSQPKYIIGPHWYLYLLMNILIIGLGTFIYIEFLNRVFNQFLGVLFVLSIIFLLGVYFYNFIINPGILYKQLNQKDNGDFCQICESYIPPGSNTVHCKFCNVCVTGFDHHCAWIGKCVGKNNLFSFYFLLGSVSVVYAVIFGAAIYFVIKTLNSE